MSLFDTESSFLLDALESEWKPSIHVLPLTESDVFNFLDVNPDAIVKYLQDRAPLAESLLKRFAPDILKPAKGADVSVQAVPQTADVEHETLPQGLPDDDILGELFPGIELAPELFLEEPIVRADDTPYHLLHPDDIQYHGMDPDLMRGMANYYAQQQEAIPLSDDEQDHDAQDDEAQSDEEQPEYISSSDEDADQELDAETDAEANHDSDDDSEQEATKDTAQDYVEDSDDEDDQASDNESDSDYCEQATHKADAESEEEEDDWQPTKGANVRLTPDSPVGLSARKSPARAHTPSPSPPTSPKLASSPTRCPTPLRDLSSGPPTPTASPEDDNSFMPFPAPANLVSASKYEPEGKKWRLFEEEACIRHMVEIRDEGKLKGEARFAEAQRRMARVDGIVKTGKFAVKNFWNRVGRARSGFDERKNKNAPLATSKQGRSAAASSTARNKRKAPSSSSTTANKRRRRALMIDTDDEDAYASDYSVHSDGSEPVRARPCKRRRDDPEDSEDDWQPDDATINALQKGLRAPKKARTTY